MAVVKLRNIVYHSFVGSYIYESKDDPKPSPG